MELPQHNPQDDSQDKDVVSALEVIQKNYHDKVQRDNKNEKIQDLFERGFTVAEPDGPRKINSKMLQQAILKVSSRMKPLDFAIHGTGRDEVYEKIVTDGVATVMKLGEYDDSLRDKDGAFWKLLLYGDGFMHVGANPEKTDVPILFNPISNSNVYVDTFATSVRGAWGRGATKMVVIFSYSWEEFISLYPKMKNKAGLGRVPRQLTEQKELEQSDNQEIQQEDMVEVAHYYDIANDVYVQFAGAATTVIKKESGDKYPFKLNKKSYIPVVQFLCFPAAEGFHNHGIGDMIYDLAIVSQRLMNMGVGHAEDTAYPVELINIPEGESASFFNKIGVANELRSQGHKSWIPMEYDPNNPGGKQVTSQTLLPQSLYQEWVAIYERLDREVKRMGINLDDIQYGTSVTATQILAEEEAQNSFIKQIMEWNASETEFCVDLTMDMIEHFVGKKNRTPLNLTTKVETPNGDIRADSITLGMVASELKQYHYFVKVNARSGVIPSNTMQQAQLMRMMQATPPGTPAYYQYLHQFSQLHDRDTKPEAFMPQAPQAPQGQGEVPEGTQATGTDRQSFRPTGQPEPVI